MRTKFSELYNGHTQIHTHTFLHTHTHTKDTRNFVQEKANCRNVRLVSTLWTKGQGGITWITERIAHNNFHSLNFKTWLYNNTGLSKPTLPLVRDKRNIKADEWEKSLKHLLVIFCCPFFFILNSVQCLFEWPVRSSVYFYERNKPRSAKANFHWILTSAIPLQIVNSFPACVSASVWSGAH